MRIAKSKSVLFFAALLFAPAQPLAANSPNGVTYQDSSAGKFPVFVDTHGNTRAVTPGSHIKLDCDPTDKVNCTAPGLVLDKITPTGGTAGSDVADLFGDMISVRAFGALPDAIDKSATGVSITSGTAALTCGNCTFTSADAGKLIAVSGAGAAGAILLTTISSVTDATHVTLAANAGTTLSSASVAIEYGTDAAAKIQGYLNTFTNFSGQGAYLYWPSGTYLVKGLVLPKGAVSFLCSSPGSTTLKLPSGANAYMMADESYTNSLSTGDNTFRIRGCTLDGNNTNQAGNSALAIHHREVWYENNVLQNAAGAAIYIPAKGADGTTCGSIGNSKFFNDKFQNNSGQGVLSLDGGCIGIADQWYSGNTFNANTLSCDAGGQNYGIYTDRSSGFTVIRNRFFGQAGCGDLHLNGNTASVLVEGNTFDGNANTANGANPIKGVWVDTGTGSQWSGATVTGNVFKYTNSALPGSATEMRLLEYDNNATGSPPGCVCGGNTFFSVNLAGVKSIVYGGTHVGDVHLNAKGNTYGANAAEPTDTNIDTKVLLANANLSDLPSVSTALANLTIEKGIGNGDSDITIACTTSEEHTFAAFTAAHTWTLPSISSCGFNSGHRVIVTDTQATVTSTNTLTVAPNTGDTIVGATADKTINESRGEIWCIVTKSLTWKCTLRQGAARLATTGVVQPSNNGSEFTNMATFRSNTGTNNASNLTAGTVAAAQGGAGTVNGILKANGAGAVSQAVSSTDYAPATSGSSILKGNGTGGFSSYAGGSCSGQFVRSLGADGTPACNSVDLSADTASTALPVAKGGTGSATASAARVALGIDHLTAVPDADYSIGATDKVLYPSALSASRTWTLPPASSINAGESIRAIDLLGVVGTSHQIFFKAQGGDTVNGAACCAVAAADQYASGQRIFTSDGVSKWTTSAMFAGGGSEWGVADFAQLVPSNTFSGATNTFNGAVVVQSASIAGNRSDTNFGNGFGMKNTGGNYSCSSCSGTQSVGYGNEMSGASFSTPISSATITDAATLHVGTPAAGSHVTITNPHSIVADGDIKAAGGTFTKPTVEAAGANNAASFSPGGKLDILTANVAGTLTGSDETLHSYSLPANALDAVGREVTIEACWNKAANSDSITNKVWFGATNFALTTTTVSITSCAWMDVVKTGANTQQITSWGANSGTWAATKSVAGSETDTSAIVIKATANEATAAGDSTLVKFVVRYWN